jgi:hypothetical protein
VTTAILATKKLRAKDGLDRAAKIEAIAGMVPNPSSAFIQKLRDQAAGAPPAAVNTPNEPTPSQNEGEETK